MAVLYEFFDFFFSCRFRYDIIFTSSSGCLEVAPDEVDCCSLEVNFGLLLRADLLFLTLACQEAIDPICMILGSFIMFTILKGLDVFSRPSIPRDFFCNFTFFGVTSRLSISKSYWETYEIESVFRTLGSRFSTPSSISMA